MRPWKGHKMKCFRGHCELFHTEIDSVCSFSLEYQAARRSNLNVGDWVVVQYDNLKFPSEVIQVIGEDTKVSVMHTARKGRWYWPSQNDAIHYKPESVF